MFSTYNLTHILNYRNTENYQRTSSISNRSILYHRLNMFGRNSGGQSAFGTVNASTPTSTPAPAMNNQFPQKTNGLFGNVSSNFGTSTPSPSGTFGNNNMSQNNQASGGLFGNASQPTGQTSNNLFSGTTSNTNATTNKPAGLFGNNNTSTSIKPGLFGSTGATNNTSTGLFGNTNNANPTQTGGLFGSSNTTTTPATSGGLFGNSNKPTTSGGLFGNNTTNANQSGSLFGNSTSSNQPGTGLSGNNNLINPTSASSTTTSGGLFGTKPTIGTSTTTGGLFGNNSSNTGSTTSQGLFGTKPQGVSNLFGNSTQVTNVNTQSFSNNLNQSNMQYTISNMPASITPSTHRQEPSVESKQREGSISQYNDNRTAFSLPSNNLSTTRNPQVLPSNIFGKLNSRLNYIKESSTRGIFSPSYNEGWSSIPSKSKLKSDEKYLSSKSDQNKSIKDISLAANKRADISTLRILRIDSDRSAAKKLKLLSNTAIPTKEISQSNEKLDHPEEAHSKVTYTLPTENSTIESLILKKNDENNNEFPQEMSSDIPEANMIAKENDSTTADYWCSPSAEELLQLSIKQLAAVPNFMIGRKGYGTISFNYDVDLTAFAKNIKSQLFGNVVVFHPSRTVEVYPDTSIKPNVGCGINVPATISIEGIYPVDKKTKKTHRNPTSSSEIQILIRRLKSMKEMEFISYNPFGGIWTFKVNHFSIWGLVDSEDIEIDENEIEEDLSKGQDYSHKTTKVRTLAQSNLPDVHESLNDITQDNLLTLQQRTFLNNENDSDVMDDNQLLEEKHYEPDIKEEDLELMEVDPPLDVANDWVEQLKVTGSSINSIFAKESSVSKLEENAMSLLFSKFNEDFETMKKICKERKLVSHYSFVKFDFSSRLLVKDTNMPSGTRILPLNPKLNHNNLIMKDSMLDMHLKSITLETRSKNNYPIVTAHSLDFKSMLPLINTSSEDYQVWKLCSILYDPIELPHDVDNDIVKETLLKRKRYSLLCDWVVEQVTQEINYKLKNTVNPLDKIFLYLLLNDNINAARVAVESNNGYLSVLLSFLGSNDPRVVEYATQQLDAWESSGHQIDPEVRRIYQILSVSVFSSHSLLSKLREEFSWLAIFGLGLFYGKIDESSLKDLIFSLISYIDNTSNDLLYVSLQLFSAQDSIEDLFKTIKADNQLLGAQFSWYFVQILKYQEPTNFSDEYCDLITLDLIELLRVGNFLEQALYCSCFIKKDEVAAQQIYDLVTRNISKLTENETFLNRLHVPKATIYEALALFDKYNGNYLSELQNLLNAELYEDAEKVMMFIAGPKLVLHYNLDKNLEILETLRSFIKQFPKESMEHWDSTLSVFENFLMFLLDENKNEETIKNIKNGLRLLLQNRNHKLVPACCDIINKEIRNVRF